MQRQLELAYNWRTPAAVSTIGLVIGVGILVNSRVSGWLGATAILALVWVGYVGLVWLRSRAYVQVDGAILRVRRFRGFHDLDGRQLRSVSQFLTRNGPSYKLSFHGTDGHVVRHIVPTALLHKGHSTLFEWILTWAPDAELDKGSRKTLEQLRIRGLL